MKNIAMVLFAIFLLGCTSKPVMNIQQERIPAAATGRQLSVAEVEKAILSASERAGWVSKVIQPGLIEAKISRRDHKATIRISYSSTSYSINYKNSDGLDYDDGDIHRNYNNWIAKLNRTIKQQLEIGNLKHEFP